MSFEIKYKDEWIFESRLVKINGTWMCDDKFYWNGKLVMHYYEHCSMFSIDEVEQEIAFYKSTLRQKKLERVLKTK